MMNYNNKKFRSIANSENGEISNDVIFTYQQQENILTCSYKRGKIIQGHLIGIVAKDGIINMRYHQINTHGELRTGIGISKPEIMINGKIRLYEKWQWTSNNQSKGESILEEV